jgi:hypothetical protein
MAKQRRMVEYGYEEQDELQEKGTLVVLDVFHDTTAAEVEKILAIAEAKKFVKVVFFPHNDKTLSSMGLRDAPPYYKRVQHLEGLLDEISSPMAVRIDTWEDKRKKYTPMELILRYLAETYRAPFFLYLTDGYANHFATFASFEACIKSVRLLIDPKYGVPAHPRLTAFENRWDYV